MKWVIICYGLIVTIALIVFVSESPSAVDDEILRLETELAKSKARETKLQHLADSLDIMLVNQNYLYVTTKHKAQTLEAEYNKLKNNEPKKIHTNSNVERDSLLRVLYPADSLWR